MQTTILFKAPRRGSNSPIVILNALSLCRQSSTTRRIFDAGKALCRSISNIWAGAINFCSFSRTITAISVVCAFTALFAGLDYAFTNEDDSRILLSVSTLLGLPLTIIGAFISAEKKGGLI